jgi:predicted porin
MKKNLLAVAVLGVAAGTASAQSNVTIYGLVDIGLAFERGGAAGSVTKLDGSGMHSGNRVGFRGTEDLGGGLSAIFTLENGYNPDNGTLGQGGLLFGRQAFVGLKGDFGTATAGRQYSPHWAAVDSLDPLDGITGGSFNLLRRTVRTDNTLKYTTPNFSGLTADIAYGFGEVAGNTSASRTLGGSLAYAQGPLVVKLAHHNGRNAADTDATKNSFLGGSYNFGPAKAFLGYQTEKGLGALDRDAALIGAQVPFGPHTVMASYIHKNDKAATNNDANMVGVAYTYALSKRTNLYTSYVKIDNKNSLVYTTKVGDGSGDKEFNVGIRHKF